MKISGKKEVFYQVAGIVSFLAGGYMATRSYGIAFTITIIVGAVALLQSFGFKEPSIGRRHEAEERGNVFVNQLKESVAVVRGNPRIGSLIVFTEIILTFLLFAELP